MPLEFPDNQAPRPAPKAGDRRDEAARTRPAKPERARNRVTSMDPANAAAHSREVRRKAEEAVERAGVDGREVLRKIAEHMALEGADAETLKIGAAAATYALTSLESARLIAEQVRIEAELRGAPVRNAASAGAWGDRAAIAETLTG